MQASFLPLPCILAEQSYLVVQKGTPNGHLGRLATFQNAGKTATGPIKASARPFFQGGMQLVGPTGVCHPGWFWRATNGSYLFAQGQLRHRLLHIAFTPENVAEQARIGSRVGGSFVGRDIQLGINAVARLGISTQPAGANGLNAHDAVGRSPLRAVQSDSVTAHDQPGFGIIVDPKNWTAC